MNVSCDLGPRLHAGAYHLSPIYIMSYLDPGISRIRLVSSTLMCVNCSSVLGLNEHGYGKMTQAEDMLASYLLPSGASFLKAPVLPTKPLRTTVALVGKEHTAAGQAAGCLHNLAVLQAYQAELLEDFEETIKSDYIAELRRATDLSLRATKETAKAIGRSMAALVVTERHLWLNRSQIKDKDRAFLLNAPISPSGLFGAIVSYSYRVDPHNSRENERRPVAHCEAFLKAVGSNGSCVQRDYFWPAAHEILAVVTQDHKVFPEGQPISQDQGQAAMLSCLRDVEDTMVPVTRPSVGGSLSSHNAYDGRLPHGLGGGRS